MLDGRDEHLKKTYLEFLAMFAGAWTVEYKIPMIARQR